MLKKKTKKTKRKNCHFILLTESGIQTGHSRESWPLPLHVWGLSGDVVKAVLVKLGGNRPCCRVLVGVQGGSAISIKVTRAQAL